MMMKLQSFFLFFLFSIFFLSFVNSDDGFTQIRFVHTHPSVGAVWASVGNSFFASNITFNTGSPLVSLSSGVYSFTFTSGKNSWSLKDITLVKDETVTFFIKFNKTASIDYSINPLRNISTSFAVLHALSLPLFPSITVDIYDNGTKVHTFAVDYASRDSTILPYTLAPKKYTAEISINETHLIQTEVSLLESTSILLVLSGRDEEAPFTFVLLDADFATTQVRFGHAVSDAGKVDVVINGQKLVTDLGFKEFSNTFFNVRSQVSLAEIQVNNKTVFSSTLILERNSNYFVYVCGEANTSKLELVSYKDNPTFDSENSFVSIGHLSPHIGPVNITLSSSTILDTLTYKSFAAHELPSGDYFLRVYPAVNITKRMSRKIKKGLSETTLSLLQFSDVSVLTSELHFSENSKYMVTLEGTPESLSFVVYRTDLGQADNSGLSKAGLIAIIVGSCLIVILLVAVGVYYYKSKKNRYDSIH